MENETIQIEEKVQKKHKFKFLTFASGLFNIALAALVAFALIFVIIAFPEWAQEGDGTKVIAAIIIIPLVFVFIAIAAIIAIFYLVVGIMIIVASFKDDKAYGKRRGLVITTVVFDFIQLALCLFLIFGVQGDTGGAKTILIVLAVATLLSAILKIVDLRLHKKRTSKIETQKSQLQTIETQIDFSALNDTKLAAPETKPIEKIEDIDVKEENKGEIL